MNTFLPAPEALLPLLARVPAPWREALALRLLNQILHEPLRKGELDFLQQRVVQLQLQEMDLGLRLQCRERRLQAVNAATPADVQVKAELRALLHIAARSVDADTLFFQRRLMISGDTETGLQIRNRIDAMEMPAWLQRGLQKLATQWPLLAA